MFELLSVGIFEERRVAQLASVRALGARGPGFESRLSDKIEDRRDEKLDGKLNESLVLSTIEGSSGFPT